MQQYNGKPENVSRAASVAITSSTNTTPISVRCAAGHGRVTGDVIVVYAHLVNLSANGEWKVVATSPIDLQLYKLDGTASVGTAVGAATGSVVFEGVNPTFGVTADGDERAALNVDVALEGAGDRTAWLAQRTGNSRLIASNTPGFDASEPPAAIVTWNQAAYTAGSTLVGAPLAGPLIPGDLITWELALTFMIANGTGHYYVKPRRSFDGGATVGDVASGGGVKALFSVLGGELNTYRNVSMIGWDVIPANTAVADFRLYLIGRSTSAAPSFDLLGNAGVKLRAWRTN